MAAPVGITVGGPGGGPAGPLPVRRTGAPDVTLAAGGRGVDLDGDGTIGLAEGVGTKSPGPLAAISSRDGLKQTGADLMQLVRAIRRGVGGDGAGGPGLRRPA